MLFWFVRRLAQSVLMILFLLTAVFFVVRLAPGDPLDQAIEEEQSAADRELMRHRLGLDKSLTEQYVHWLANSLKGDFGVSMQQQRPVAAIIKEAMGPTLLLTVTSYTLLLLLSIVSALVMARWRDSVADQDRKSVV